MTAITTLDASSATLDAHNYAYNDANQRTRVDLPDGSYWLYQYDKLGQVTAGQKYWSNGATVAGQQFGYQFDDIGNRTTASRNTDQVARTAAYSPNALNQYDSRTVPGFAELVGTANSNATVTVNYQRAQRNGEYFRKELALNNTGGAVWQSVTNIAVLNNGTNADIVTTNIGNVYLPPLTETFGYDPNGNLTNDGRWAFTWDGENRLLSQETTSAAVSAGVPKQRLVYEYDYLSRRTHKRVYGWNSGSSAWVLGTETKFLYDGWNLLAELDGSNNPVRSYVWGLDLSGSLRGAGGVGGLLAINTSSASAFVSYDGNGNVTTLVDTSTSAITAQYEYGPFGEMIRATGGLALANPFRFSTKYADDESDFLYYGYRYYNPSTGRWLSRDPLEEESGANLYGFCDNDGINFDDDLGDSKGHHVFPQALSKAMSKAVRDFFDEDVNRIFNDYYKTHGAGEMAGINAKDYNKLISEELETFLGRSAIKNMTLEEARKFMAHLDTLPKSNPINIYNRAVEREAYAAMKLALAQQAERAAASSLIKAEARGARRLGGKRLGKAIPIIGSVVAVYFIWDDAKVYGAGPAIANGVVTAIPLVGTGVVGSEIVAGGRWLDVLVGPKEVHPTDIGCGSK